MRGLIAPNGGFSEEGCECEDRGRPTRNFGFMAATHRPRSEGSHPTTSFRRGIMANELKLTFSLADYDRTRPLLYHEVRPEGIDFDFRPAVPGEACLRPIYEEFDIAEMSLSWYTMARLRGEPVIALPIFPMRMFIQP